MFRNAKRMGRWITIALAIGLVCPADGLAKKPPTPPPPKETAPYTFVDLLGLPGANFLQSDAQSVSQPDAAGAFFVAGLSRDADGFCPVLWSVDADGFFAGPLDLDGPALHVPVATNDAGIVVTGSGHVFVFGEVYELPRLGAVDANARAINNYNQIVGWIVYDDGTTREGFGALWTLDEDGVPGDPILLGSFFPKDVSDTGVMAGELEDIAIAAVARFEGGELQVDPLGVLPGFSWSMADAVSSDGTWVAGTCRREGPWQAFIWSEVTGMINLGSLTGGNSHAYDVNNAGQVVGIADTNEGRYSMTAVLWDNGQVFDLNTLTDAGNKTHLQIAKGINNAGHIVGLMDMSRPVSESHGYVLIPNVK